MKTTIHESVRDEKGFTLVELAVVMIIIGLLVGGILKGQEMIANAQVTATVAQLKGVNAATSTFRDMYGALPGDINNPQTRLAGCTAAPCTTAGNGDSQLTNGPGSVAGENLGFWVHLGAADLLSGIDGSDNAFWGQGLPAAKAGGGFAVGYTANGTFTNGLGTGRGGHWVTIQGIPGTVASPGVSASEAARMDRKIDDGVPGTGSVISSGAAACGSATVYDEVNDYEACAVNFRIQG